LKNLIDAPLYVDETPGLSVFEFRTKARRLVREHHVECIIVDYLQLMTASGMGFSRQEEVSTISRSLKGLAKELKIPILALSQVNRDVEKRTDPNNAQSAAESKRPQLSDLRESGAIEQDADIVIFIHRPEYYRIYEDRNGNDLHGMAEIIIAKHRNGKTGEIYLRFKSDFAKFQNPNDDNIPMPGDENANILGSKMNDSSYDGDAPMPDFGKGNGDNPFVGMGNEQPMPF
jgi:replicative DNA helicase